MLLPGTPPHRWFPSLQPLDPPVTAAEPPMRLLFSPTTCCCGPACCCIVTAPLLEPYRSARRCNRASKTNASCPAHRLLVPHVRRLQEPRRTSCRSHRRSSRNRVVHHLSHATMPLLTRLLHTPSPLLTTVRGARRERGGGRGKTGR